MPGLTKSEQVVAIHGHINSVLAVLGYLDREQYKQLRARLADELVDAEDADKIRPVFNALLDYAEGELEEYERFCEQRKEKQNAT